jgi:hypothetical protein
MQVKKFKELSTEWALAQVQGDEECKRFVPDLWFEPKAKLSRSYLFKVLITVRTHYLVQVIKHAKKARVVEK